MAQQIQDFVESRRIARMSHEPSVGPDEVVLKSFLPLNGVKPPPANPFPALRPTSHVDRQMQAQQFMGRAQSPNNARDAAGSPMGAGRGGLKGGGGPNAGGMASLNGTVNGRNATATPLGGTMNGTSTRGGDGFNTSSTANNNGGGGGGSAARERIVLPPPSSRWYPAKEVVKPVMGEAVDPSVPASVESPRAMQRATQRKEVATEVVSHFLVNPPPGVGGKKRKSAGGTASRGNSANNNRGSPAAMSLNTTAGGGGTKKKKGVLNGAQAIPSTTDAIADTVKTQAEAASNGQPYVPGNLKALLAVFRSFMDDEGRLNGVTFTKALRDVGVTDMSTADSIFRRLESRSSPGYVFFGSVMAAFHEVLNGPATNDIIISACFNLFDLNNRGYIHKDHLNELKLMRVTLDNHAVCTPHMVKVLTDVFADVKQKEEDHYVLMVIRKGKKSSKKKPPALKTHQNSVIPVERQVVQHIDRRLFAAYFATHREVALAFAPRWIPLIDTNDDVGMAASEAMMRYENPPTPRNANTADGADGSNLDGTVAEGGDGASP